MRTGIRGLHESSALQEWETAAPEPLSCVQLGNAALREQIVDIILDVLSDTEPARPEVRARMLQHLAENPGHPERALLDHLRDPGIRSDATDSGAFETQDV
jgi:hypothetical protein